MTRQVWCGECGEKKRPGTRQIYAASPEGEPAEYERIVKGRAKQPKPEQRVMYINAVAHPLATDHFDCDDCSKPIYPGDLVTTWTVWVDGYPEPDNWEQEYLEVTP